MFVDVVARGGNLLINVAPTATGAIPWLQAQRLLALGWWLRVNGEAIYGPRARGSSRRHHRRRLPIRYTASDRRGPRDRPRRPARRGRDRRRLDDGAEVRLAGRSTPLPWQPSPGGVRIALPEIPDPQPAIAVRISPPTAVHGFQEV